MTLSQQRALTDDIFQAIRERTRFTDSELADAMGCSRSHANHIQAGRKKLSLGYLVGLCREYGADVVLSPLARRHACRVVSTADTTPSADLLDLTLTMGELVGKFQGEVIRARMDGHVDAAERRILRRLVARLRQLADELEVLLTGEE